MVVEDPSSVSRGLRRGEKWVDEDDLQKFEIDEYETNREC